MTRCVLQASNWACHNLSRLWLQALVRFIVDLEAGKPTLRLENVRRVIDTLGGTLQLIGLPSSAPENQPKGNQHGA